MTKCSAQFFFRFRCHPRQVFIGAFDKVPLAVAFYPFQFSWLGYLESLGGLFILIDTYWIHEKRIRWLRNKRWILSGSFHTSEESQPAEEKILSQLQKFVWGLYVLPFRKRLSVVNNMNFLWRHSENISFWLHMLTFSVLKMWVSKWPFTCLLQEALNHSSKELFICWLLHSRESLEGKSKSVCVSMCECLWFLHWVNFWCMFGRTVMPVAKNLPLRWIEKQSFILLNEIQTDHKLVLLSKF